MGLRMSSDDDADQPACKNRFIFFLLPPFEHLRWQENNRPQQTEDPINRNPYQPERKQQEPDNRIQYQSQKRQRPTEKEEDKPEQEFRHSSPLFRLTFSRSPSFAPHFSEPETTPSSLTIALAVRAHTLTMQRKPPNRSFSQGPTPPTFFERSGGDS